MLHVVRLLVVINGKAVSVYQYAILLAIGTLLNQYIEQHYWFSLFNMSLIKLILLLLSMFANDNISTHDGLLNILPLLTRLIGYGNVC